MNASHHTTLNGLATRPGEKSGLVADRFVDLLRHGEVAGGFRLRGVTDDPLSPDGHQQMRQALGAERPWRRVLSSGLQRCDAFAHEIATETDVPLDIEPRFREIDFGDWEGKEVAAVWEEDHERASAFWNNPFAVAPPGGEDPGAMKQRVLAAWDALLSQLGGSDHCLVVTHGGPIRLILGSLLDMPDAALVRIEVPHASLTRIRVPADGYPPSLMFHR